MQTRWRARWSAACGAAVFSLLSVTFLPGQQTTQPQTAQPAKAFTLVNAVQYAADHYPSIRAAMERKNAAAAAVGLARGNYLPRADVLWQTNRATRNNVAGILLPQSTIPNPSGPVLETSSQSFWGTGAGMLVSWEPFDFGYRRAVVDSARATVDRTASQVQLTLLDVKTATADAALTVLAAEQRVKATEADVNRRAIFARSVHALVDAHLRPGADASRADAELAAARTTMILAQQNEAVSKASLAEWLDLAGQTVEVVPGPLLESPGAFLPPATSVATHPAAVTEQDRILEAKARIHILNRSYVPKFGLQGAGYGRGTGAMGNGKPANESSQGLAPDTPNWAAGVTVKFAIFDYASIHSQKKVEQANERQQERLYEQTIQTVTAQSARAQAALEGAQRVAENTPVELRASQDAERQARARFQAGVATLVDVAEAQRLLVNAEIDDSLARLGIWRAIERLSAAQGNLQPFLNLVEQSSGSQGSH